MAMSVLAEQTRHWGTMVQGFTSRFWAGTNSRSELGEVRLLPYLSGQAAIAALVGLFVAYLVGGGLAQALAIVPGSGISLWPPAGLLLAGFLVAPERGWLWVALAGFAAEMLANAIWFGNPAPVAAALYGANLMGALTGAALLRISGPMMPFETGGQVARLAILGGAVAQSVSATLGCATLAVAGIQPFGSAWPLWWLGDVTGVLIFAPPVLVLAQSGWRLFPRKLLPETVAICLCFGLLQALYVAGIIPFAYIVTPALLWAAMRLRLPGTVLILVLFVVVLGLATVLGGRHFPDDPADRTRIAIELQLFLALSGLTSLALAATATGLSQAMVHQRRANEVLQALATERGQVLEVSERRLQAAEGAGQLAWMEMSQPKADAPLRVSEGFRALYDLPPDRPVTAAAIVGVIDSADRRRVRRAYADLMATGREFDIEFKLANDGAEGKRWLRAIGVADPTPEGSPRMISTVSYDITDRRRAEETLAESRRALDRHLAELEALYSGAPMGLALLDTHLRVMRANPTLLQMSNIESETHIGRMISDVVGQFGQAEVRQLRQVLETAAPVLDVPIRCVPPDGQGDARVWSGQFYPVRDQQGLVVGIGVILDDMTERNILSERLREREELYRDIFRLAGTGIVLADGEGVLQSCNPAFAAMVQRPESALSNRHVADLVEEDDRDGFVAWLGRVLKGDELPDTIDLRCCGAGDGRLHVRVQGSLLHDQKNLSRRIILLFTDMTEVTLAGDRQKILLNELDHRAKNLMAIVQAIANRTFVAGADPAAARRAFSGRISALARSLDVLAGANIDQASLADIAQSQLAAFGQRVTFSGPDVMLPPRNAQMCALILHELATNAVKHGALSVREGQVQLTWAVAGAAGDRFVLHWAESGGPPSSAPERRGFGSLLVTEIAGESLNCSPVLTYGPGGFEYTIDAPLDSVVGPSTKAQFSDVHFGSVRKKLPESL